MIHAPKVLAGIRHRLSLQAGVAEVRPVLCGLQPGLVSVVLPVYNQACYLDAAIRGVLAQTYVDFELIIIDDGSTDDVASVLRPYLGHPRIRCFTQGNLKLPKALSHGFDLARGEFWTWTSADNVMAPEMLDTLVAKLRVEPRLGMVYADYIAIDDRDRPITDPSWRAHDRPDPGSGVIRLPRQADRLNAVLDNFIGPCFMYRGWIGRCIGDYDQRLGVEDYDYWMRINAHFELRHLGRDDLLYRYRVHDNSLSGQSATLDIPGRLRALMAHEKERNRYFLRQPAYLADAEGRAWLAAFEAVPGRIRPFSAGLATWRLRHADLLIISCETAVAELADIIRLRLPIAILFAAGSDRGRQLQSLLERPDCMALTACPAVAGGIRQMAPRCPMMDADAETAFAALHAFMKNRRFMLAHARYAHAGAIAVPVQLSDSVT